MRTTKGSFGVTLAAVMGLAAVFAGGATALAQEDRSPEALFQQIMRDVNRNIPQNGAGEQFGWGISYYAGGFVQGYQRTKDIAWLDGAQKLSEYCVEKMLTGPDGYKGWIGDDLSGRGTWADNHVGDAIIVAPMLSFAEVVLKDPGLKKKYGEAARKYVELAKRDLFEKWDKRGTWKEDRAWGCYVDWGMVSSKAHPDVWKKDTGPCIAEPFNKNNHMGVCALRLFRITGEEKWRDRAFKIFAYTKSRFQLVDEDGFSYYVWNYWEAFGPESVDLAKKDTRHWMNVHPGRPYAAGEIGQMVEAYNTGVVFDKTDIERFINTNLKVMWNGDKAKPHFSNSNWKLPMPLGPDGKSLPPEVNSSAAQLWTGLSQFSQEVRDLAGGRGRGAASEHPHSFDRLYCAEKDAKVFDWPCYHSCKSLTVAAVLPSVVKKGTSTIILCKARIPQDPFEVALYSADGKDKLLVIHQGKIDGGLDGHAGIFILQWDPASSKEKPLTGAYRIRWTGVDGYREFPVTVTE
jgi:hypothetical protein